MYPFSDSQASSLTAAVASQPTLGIQSTFNTDYSLGPEKGLRGVEENPSQPPSLPIPAESASSRASTGRTFDYAVANPPPGYDPDFRLVQVELGQNPQAPSLPFRGEPASSRASTSQTPPPGYYSDFHVEHL
ncbi:hypothetical protein C8R44DRAFT_196905 [Mycena epipterygia]|nr:hypothetical protein C8R44DRAFT_196905 [Mycena epipterygia]